MKAAIFLLMIFPMACSAAYAELTKDWTLIIAEKTYGVIEISLTNMGDGHEVSAETSVVVAGNKVLTLPFKLYPICAAFLSVMFVSALYWTFSKRLRLRDEKKIGL